MPGWIAEIERWDGTVRELVEGRSETPLPEDTGDAIGILTRELLTAAVRNPEWAAAWCFLFEREGNGSVMEPEIIAALVEDFSIGAESEAIDE